MTDDRCDRFGGVAARYEMTVAGPLGPAFRAALPAESVSDLETTTVVVSRVSGPALLDLLERLERAGVEVQAVLRLTEP